MIPSYDRTGESHLELGKFPSVPVGTRNPAGPRTGQTANTKYIYDTLPPWSSCTSELSPDGTHRPRLSANHGGRRPIHHTRIYSGHLSRMDTTGGGAATTFSREQRAERMKTTIVWNEVCCLEESGGFITGGIYSLDRICYPHSCINERSIKTDFIPTYQLDELLSPRALF